jgi:mono/diheme cytochrome c family protein
MMEILRKVFTLLGGAVVAVALLVFLLIGPLPWNNTSRSFAEIDRHFRYGSIGGESTNGLPYWIWKVLPDMFADQLPIDAPATDYTAFGFLQEPGEDLPIGFARSRTSGIDVVTQNCATCHVGSVRTTTDAIPELISGMPSHNVNLQAYIKFLRDVADDSRFTSDQLIPYIQAASGGLGPIEKLVYRFVAIPRTREQLTLQRANLAFMDRQIPYGPGRIDTFTPYKTLRFSTPDSQLRQDELSGIADFPPIWMQGPRKGLQLHWDGNNDSIDERNKSAALALVQPTTINFASVHRIRDWLLDLPPPNYPFPIEAKLADRGETIYNSNCAECHAFGGAKTGTVEDIKQILTDPGRLVSYTPELASNQYSLFAEINYQGKDQRFTHFRKTNGYANLPLDGVWLRAPYLHNGSVPTLAALLSSPSDRPQTFYRGNDNYDSAAVGFVSDVPSEQNHTYFFYDTSLPGNGNGGHLYGIDLPEDDKLALIEYLKTF